MPACNGMGMPLLPKIGSTATSLHLPLIFTEPDAVTVASVQSVTWNDSSLGCPQPGMMYLQVLTPGYLVILEASGNTYEYHLSEQGNFVSCTSGATPMPGRLPVDQGVPLPLPQPIDPDTVDR